MIDFAGPLDTIFFRKNFNFPNKSWLFYGPFHVRKHFLKDSVHINNSSVTIKADILIFTKFNEGKIKFSFRE